MTKIIKKINFSEGFQYKFTEKNIKFFFFNFFQFVIMRSRFLFLLLKNFNFFHTWHSLLKENLIPSDSFHSLMLIYCPFFSDNRL